MKSATYKTLNKARDRESSKFKVVILNWRKAVDFIAKFNNVPFLVKQHNWNGTWKVTISGIDASSYRGKVKKKTVEEISTPVKFNEEKCQQFYIELAAADEQLSRQEIEALLEPACLTKAIQNTTKPAYLCALTSGNEFKKVEILRYFNLPQIYRPDIIRRMIENLNVKAKGLYNVKAELEKYDLA